MRVCQLRMEEVYARGAFAPFPWVVLEEFEAEGRVLKREVWSLA